MFICDLETLGTESNCVVLSAALIHFEFESEDLDPSRGADAFYHLVNSACVVKFKKQEQIDLGRTVEERTLDWWDKQCDIVKKAATDRYPEDVSAALGIQTLRKYIDDNGGPNQIFWARGSLDQMAIDSLCRNIGVPHLTQYNMWRDVRTAVDILASNAKNGYCRIKGFNSDLHVIKHLPSHDCALDVLMLVNHE